MTWLPSAFPSSRSCYAVVLILKEEIRPTGTIKRLVVSRVSAPINNSIALESYSVCPLFTSHVPLAHPRRIPPPRHFLRPLNHPLQTPRLQLRRCRWILPRQYIRELQQTGNIPVHGLARGCADDEEVYGLCGERGCKEKVEGCVGGCGRHSKG